MKSLPIVIIRNDTEILALSRMMKHWLDNEAFQAFFKEKI